MPNQSITIESRADVVEKYKDTLPDGMLFTQQVMTDSRGKTYNPAKYDWIVNNADIKWSDMEIIASLASDSPNPNVGDPVNPVAPPDGESDGETNDRDTEEVNKEAPPIGEIEKPDNGGDNDESRREAGQAGENPELDDSIRNIGKNIEPVYSDIVATSADQDVLNSTSSNDSQGENQDQGESEEDQGAQDTQEPTNQKISGGLGGVIAPEAADGDTSEAQNRVNFIYEATLKQNEESGSDDSSEDKEKSEGFFKSLGVTKKQAAVGSAALLTGITILSSGD